MTALPRPTTDARTDEAWDLISMRQVALDDARPVPLSASPRWFLVREGALALPNSADGPLEAGDAALLPPGPSALAVATGPTSVVEALLYDTPALHRLPRTLVVAGFAERHAGVAALVGLCPLSTACTSALFAHSYGSLLAAAMTVSWQESCAEPDTDDRDPLHMVVTALTERPADPWSLDAMAALAHLSRSALTDQFRTRLGRSPMQVLRDVRMSRARALLRQPGRSVGHVAVTVGYGSNAAFTRAFAAVHGSTPQQWRSAARGA